MTFHIALFRWADGVTPEDGARLGRELAAFRDNVGVIIEYYYGPDLGLREGNADFGIVAVVA